MIIDYSCGGTSTQKKLIKFKFDAITGKVSNIEVWEGPCGPDGVFITSSLIKATPKSEKEISNHIKGIKLKLKIEHAVDSVIFIF